MSPENQKRKLAPLFSHIQNHCRRPKNVPGFNQVRRDTLNGLKGLVVFYPPEQGG